MWTIENTDSVGLSIGLILRKSTWKVNTGAKSFNMHFLGMGAGLEFELETSAKTKWPTTGELFFTSPWASLSAAQRQSALTGGGCIIDYGFGKAVVFTPSFLDPVTVIPRLMAELPVLGALAATKPTLVAQTASQFQAFAFIATGEVKAQVKIVTGQWI